MQVSAEIRWFWRDVPPLNLEEWFCSAPCAAGGAEQRADEYFCDPSQGELSLERREAKAGVEVKGLVAAAFGDSTVGPFVGPIELWTKWTCEAFELPSGSTVPVEKVRWLRKFDTAKQPPEEIPVDIKEKPVGGQALPTFGCNVELTRIRLPNNTIWWTLGFESFGTIQTVDKALAVAAMTLAARRPPDFGTGVLASYPAWLKEYVVAAE